MNFKERNHLSTVLFKLTLCFLALTTGVAATFAGDSIYGTIVEVKSGDVVVLDYGTGRYTIRLVGIQIPSEGTFSKQAKLFVSKLILKKRVQIRFEYRNETNEMVSRILTMQSAKMDITDVGEKLVEAGIARKQADYDYKCGCLTKAENEAKTSKRGVWASK